MARAEKGALSPFKGRTLYSQKASGRRLTEELIRVGAGIKRGGGYTRGKTKSHPLGVGEELGRLGVVLN